MIELVKDDMQHEVPHLALHLVTERMLSLPSVTCENSGQVAQIAGPLIGTRPTEHLLAFLLDGRAHVTGIVTVAQGGQHGIGVRPSDVLRAVLVGQASAFVLVHNHPSGDATPSREDVVFTNKIAEAARVVGCPLLDHVVVTRSGAFSSVPFTLPDEDS